MRSYLVLAATILCVVLFDWWGQSQLTEIAQQGAALSQQMSEAVRREDWAQAEPLLAQLEDCFDEHAPMLARLVEHSQIGAIETATRQLATLVSRRDVSLALVTLDTLQLGYEDLSAGVAVSWENLIQGAAPPVRMLPL